MSLFPTGIGKADERKRAEEVEDDDAESEFFQRPRDGFAAALYEDPAMKARYQVLLVRGENDKSDVVAEKDTHAEALAEIRKAQGQAFGMRIRLTYYIREVYVTGE